MLLGILIAIFGTAGLFIWLIFYLFVLHQEKGEKLVGWLAGMISWLSKKAEKTATSMSIQAKVDSFVSSINTEVEGLLPYALKIKWVSPETTREAFIEKDRVVVLLSHHKNQDENVSKATAFYMAKAVIPEARPQIDRKLSSAIDLMMTKKALYSFIESGSALDHFVTTVLRPQTESDEEIKSLCKAIEVTDERGLFTRILLRELLELGRRRAGITETGDTVAETNAFVKHLETIAEKEKGVDVDPGFLKKHVRIAVVLIARSGKIGAGHDQYIHAIDKLGIRTSARSIYIFARSEKNVTFAKEVVAKTLSRHRALHLVHEEEFPTKYEDGKIAPGYSAILYNRQAP